MLNDTTGLGWGKYSTYLEHVEHVDMFICLGSFIATDGTTTFDLSLYIQNARLPFTNLHHIRW